MKRLIAVLKYPVLFLGVSVGSMLLSFLLYPFFYRDITNVDPKFLLLISYLAGIFFICYLMKHYHTIPKAKMKYFELVMIGFASSFLGNYVISIFVSSDVVVTKFIPLQFATSVFLGPIIEEYVFRGYVFDKLRTFYQKKYAILLSSLIYAFFHFNLFQFFFAFFLGILLACIYDHSDDIKHVIIVHMTTNFIGFFYPNIISYIHPLLLAILSFSILILLLPSYKKKAK